MDGLIIDNNTNKYSENLFSVKSVFDGTITLNKTGGTSLATIGYSEDYVYKKGKSIKSYITDTNVLAPVFNEFNLGDALSFTCPKDGNYVFSFNALAVFSPSVDSVEKIVVTKYVNSLPEDIEFLFERVDFTNLRTEKWYNFSQSFDLVENDVVDFSFKHYKELNSAIPTSTLYLDGFKIELNDRFNGIPTPYSLPKYYYFTSISNFVFVDDFNKLPTPLAGVINLEDEKTYYFTKNIDLLGNRLVCGQNTTILGTSSENASITSTGLGVGIPLITSIYTVPIRHISIKDVDTALSFDGTTNPNNMALDWTGLNFVNVPNVGTIKKASNFIFDKGSFLNSKGIKFDGIIGTIALNNSLLSGDGLSGSIIEVLSTCTITRRFRVTYSSIVATSLTKGITFRVSAIVPVESYILDTINFSGGGTYIDGVTVSDNKTLFTNCKGISNTAEVSSYFMNGNATTTVISGINTPTKALGTTTSSAITQKFTNTNNRATYNGSLTRLFSVVATLSVESGNNNQIGCYIAKNGIVLNESEVYGTTTGAGRAENIVIQTLVELSTNDYIECFVENGTSVTNILVTNLSITIK